MQSFNVKNPGIAMAFGVLTLYLHGMNLDHGSDFSGIYIAAAGDLHFRPVEGRA